MRNEHGQADEERRRKGKRGREGGGAEMQWRRNRLWPEAARGTLLFHEEKRLQDVSSAMLAKTLWSCKRCHDRDVNAM